MLKQAGHQRERGEQETGRAVFKRLLIVTQACAMAWRVMRAQGPLAEQTKAFLVRLSGHQLKRTRPLTLPALLDGMYKLFMMLETLEHVTLSELKQFAQFTLPCYVDKAPPSRVPICLWRLMIPHAHLYAAILPDKTQDSAARFLTKTVIAHYPYQIEYAYSDNGKEYQGTAQHAFVLACAQHGIGQKFTRVNRPQTHGKAERVIRTLRERWRQQHVFKDEAHRQLELVRFVNFYNTVKPHKSLMNATPYEILNAYFKQPITVNNPADSYNL